MAVYTKINKKDLLYINKKFNDEIFLSFKGIKQGIENTNYLLKSKNKKYILTIFEKRVSKKEIPFFMKLMDHLNNLKINEIGVTTKKKTKPIIIGETIPPKIIPNLNHILFKGDKILK